MYSYCYEFDKDRDAYDWIFESSNRNFLDKAIATSELSSNVMLESNGNFYKFNNLDYQWN